MFFSEERFKKTKKLDFLSRTSKAKLLLKRTFLSLFITKHMHGSATVEALMIIPPVYMFFLSVVWLMSLFYFHSEIGNVVNTVGYNLVTYSYAGEEALGLLGNEGISDKASILESLAVSEFLLRNKINETVSSKYISDLICEISRIDLNSEVSLAVKYRVETFVKVPGFHGFILTNRFYSKTFSGYDSENVQKETVYVTKDSKVYHTSSDCRALKRSVKEVRSDNIDNLRNKDRGKYFPCKKCCKSDCEKVYLTDYGIKYHSDSECKDLLVTVYSVWDYEVRGRKKCSFCQ